MFALDELGADFVLSQKLAAVSPQVDPAGFRILADEEMGGSDITAAVQRIPLGYGKLEKIDIVRRS